MDTDIRVRKIENGTVVDHIKAGQALNVLKILRILQEFPNATLTVATNVPSKQVGLKDILKVEGKQLKPAELDKISLVSPDATVNYIKDFQVKKKMNVSLPKTLDGVLKCHNTNCITNYENVTTRFNVIGKEPITLRCHFCERVMGEEEIIRQF